MLEHGDEVYMDHCIDYYDSDHRYLYQKIKIHTSNI